MLRLAALCAVTAIAGCATAHRPTVSPAPPRAAAPAFDGEAFAQQACAGCHMVGRTGVSRNPAAPPFRELARQHGDADLAEAIAEVSRNGHVEMPPIYTTPTEQRALVRYIRSLSAQRT